jgi:hypothetical protein
VGTSDHHELSFVTTAAASVDARALASPNLIRLDLVADAIGLGLAVMMFALGYPLIGVAVAVIAVLSLVGSVFHPFQRAMISLRAGSMLGKEARVTIDDEGARFEGELGTTFVPWSTVSAVRSNNRTMALFRDRMLLGYVPASAFSSPAHQAEVVAFARSRVGRAH